MPNSKRNKTITSKSRTSNEAKLAKSTTKTVTGKRTDRPVSNKTRRPKTGRLKTSRKVSSGQNNVCEPKLTVNIDTIEIMVNGDKDECFNIPGAKTAKVMSSDGENLSSYQNRVPIPGKHGIHALHVRTMKNGKELHIEGSPFAHRYGQNVYTSSNMRGAAHICLRRACTKLGLKTEAEWQKIWAKGDITLKRVDLAVNYRLKSESEVLTILRQVKRQMIERPGTIRINDATVTLSPRDGKEFSIALYAKGPQIRKESRFRKLPYSGKLLEHCKPILRVELRLRASELRKLGLDKLGAWERDTAEKVFAQYIGKRLDFLSITSGPVTDEELADLPSRLRPVLGLHKLGVELKPFFGERTLRRHRSDFKKRGIDLRCPNQEKGAVRPLAQLLSKDAAIKSAPKWMIDAGLVRPATK